jgi:phospholipid/cholesterol/gamma-HCH transport system substrate-binding protein
MTRDPVRPVRTRQVRRSAAAVAVAVLVSSGLTGCGFKGLYQTTLPGGADVGKHPYRVLVDFANVLDLVPQSAVKVNDVSVGRVEKVTLVDWHAQVQVLIRGDVKLPANAYAEIRQTTLLGEKFVSLTLPPAPEPSDQVLLSDAPHDGFRYPHIALGRTGSNPEVEQVLGALSLLLNGGGLEQIKTITHELNQALDGNTDGIRDLLNQLTTFTGTLDRQKERVLTALDNLDKLATTLDKQKQVLANALDAMPQALKILADERTQLVSLLKSLDNLSVVTTKVVTGSVDNTVADLRHLEPVLSELGKAGSDLANALELMSTYPFPRTAPNAIRGDYTNLWVSADLDLSDLLNNVASPVPTGVNPNPTTKSEKATEITAPQIPGLGG